LKDFFQKEKLKKNQKPTKPIIQHIYLSKIIIDLSFLRLFVGLFNHFQNPIYDKKENLPKLHFYCLLNNSEFTESMRRVLTNKLNTVFLENLENQLGPIVELEDFVEIFLVDSDYPDQRLLQITLNLTPKIAFWQESMTTQILPSFLELQKQISKTNKVKDIKLKDNKPKDIVELENEVESQMTEDVVRRSNRKIRRPKSYDDFVE